MPALDPRLEFLLSLPAKELAAHHAEEARQLREIERRIFQLLEELELARTRGESGAPEAKELERAYSELFAPLTAGVSFPPRRSGAWFSLFLLSEAGADDLRELGTHVRSRSGDVHTALVPRSAIAGLLESSAVRYAELARALFPDLSVALDFSGIADLHTSGMTGAGVKLGIVDDGIDYEHAAFLDPQGKSRIAWLWDQTLAPHAGESGPPVGSLPGFMPSGGSTYGVEYSAADLDAGIAGNKVIHHDKGAGHGTNVAYCAAGNPGAAPGASILFSRPVGILESELLLDSAYMADAFSWMFARAEQAGMPCVVNMSMSHDLGAHDGSSLLETYLDGLLTLPGRAITLSAGNSSEFNSHVRGKVEEGTPAKIVLTYYPAAGGHHDDAAEIWYGGNDRFRAKITIEDPVDSAIGSLSASPGDPVQSLTLGNGVKVALASRLAYAGNGDNWIRLDIMVPLGEDIPTRFVFELEAVAPILDGRFDAWVERSNRGTSDWLGALSKDEELTVANPATARRTISVGAHSKVSSGTPTIIFRSGKGPTRDGRTKPELAAPGYDLEDVPGGALGGTSAAAALVAGACALLFECRGKSSTWADLKQVLIDTAGDPGSSTPDKGFGMGYLQVKSACSVTPPVVDVWLRDHLTDKGAEPSTEKVFWACPDIELLDLSGAPITKPVHDPSVSYTTRVRVTARNRGTSAAVNTEVFLYWADPATNIPFPNGWRSEGLFVKRGESPAQGNRAAVQLLAPGTSEQVDFLWQPPPTTSNQAADGHFCLLARIENGADPSLVGTGGWISVTAHNNIGLHNVHMVQAAPGGGWSYAFPVVGTGGEEGRGPGAAEDGLLVWSEDEEAELEMTLPVLALPWRELSTLREHGGSLPRLGQVEAAMSSLAARVLRLEGENVEARTEVRGARALSLRQGLATLAFGGGERLSMPRLRLDTGVRIPVWIRGSVSPGIDRLLRVHLAQRSAGRPAGGITLEVSR